MNEKNSVAKSQLNILMKSLPAPVLEHCTRCKKMADYLLERASGEDWFIDADLKADFIRSAVYYHDIGKAGIQIDCIHFPFCSNNAQKNEYKRHVAEGLSAIENASGVLLTLFPEQSFEQVLGQVVSCHHESLDGSGFPRGLKGQDIPLAARIMAVIDQLDNLLFVNPAGKDFDDSFDRAFTLLEAMAGTRLDADVVAALTGNRETLYDQLSALDGKNDRKHKRDKYGMRFVFTPVWEIMKTNKYHAEVACYITELYLNDPYYGLMPAEVCLFAAEKTGQIFTFEKLEIEKLFRQLAAIKEKSERIPTVLIRISAEELMKMTPVRTKKGEKASGEVENKFLLNLKNLTDKNGLGGGRVVIGISESDIVDHKLNVNEIAENLHDAGVGFAIWNFASDASILPLLESVRVEYLVLKKELCEKMVQSTREFEIVSGMVKTAGKLNTEVIFAQIDNQPKFEAVKRTGAKYAAGSIYCPELSEKELTDLFTGNAAT